jgi:MerR family transcriptional regulator, light-induced transcriptional regulator
MRSLKTREAAALLNVSPNTLRTWERKFGYPRPLRSPGRHRAYSYAEVAALREALRRGLSVPSAISAVRDGLGTDADALVSALDLFCPAAADRAMEASLALRSLERSLDEVLLPALDEIRRRDGIASARWATARRWAVEWLCRAQRFYPSPDGGPGILIGDASGGPPGAAGPVIHALELLCRRDGLPVLVLPVEALGLLAEAIAAFEPLCVVIAGGQASDAQVVRWACSVQRYAESPPAALYLRRTRPRQLSMHTLEGLPVSAYRQLRELAAAAHCAKSAASAPQALRLAQPG